MPAFSEERRRTQCSVFGAAAEVESEFGVVSPALLLNTRSFDMESAANSPGWAQELKGGRKPETEEYGISSFVYRADRPFHPRRLNTMLKRGFFPGVLRSKGFLWSAGDHDVAVEWSQAGRAAGNRLELKPGGPWLQVAVPRSEWPAEAAKYREASYGDRRVELVFIGADMKEAKIRSALDGALVTDEELRLGPSAWSRWPGLVTEKGGSSSARTTRARTKRKRAEEP